ncbi:MAG: hypothetical protein M1381_07720 [Deltaproteobacteria bacterium]|nr:hypothetical protein [Deltaproteobacteria bacterium]MCL5792615.1 hypothetical protein [Deltaproteobacteria bacterium]
MNKVFLFFMVTITTIISVSVSANARVVADPLDTHARLLIGLGTGNWKQNTNSVSASNIHNSSFSGYLEDDSEGLYLAYHVMLDGGGLGSVTFSDGTTTNKSFIADINMDFQGVVYTTRGLSIMVGPYFGLTSVGIGGASTSSLSLTNSSFKGDAEAIIISSIGASLRVHSFIGNHIELTLLGYYGFYTPYSNITTISADTNLLTTNTSSRTYGFDNISDIGIGLQLGIRIMRQVGIFIAGKYANTTASNNGMSININSLNGIIGLGLWF